MTLDVVAMVEDVQLLASGGAGVSNGGLFPVVSKRGGGGQLSENPETGQSEVEQEEVRQEVSRGSPVEAQLEAIPSLTGGKSGTGERLVSDEAQVVGLKVEQPKTSDIQEDIQAAVSEEDDTDPSLNIQLGAVEPLLCVRN